MAAASSSPALCVCDDATFWPWRTWPDFALLPPTETLVVVPVAGYAERGDLPLDAEEGVLMRVLQRAARLFDRPDRLLVVPPLRFVLGPVGTGVFAVDPPLAHAFIAEVCRSVAASGFRRIVLCNASPANEDLCDVAARDLRIDHGLQLFCVHLGALGLDLGASDPAGLAQIARLLDGTASDALERHGRRLASLLGEIVRRPALPGGGHLGPVRPPQP